MKSARNLTLLAMLALIIVSGQRPALAANNVTVINSTSYTIYGFYASSSDASAWDTETNLLGTQSIAPGQQVMINVGTSSDGSCSFDLMAILYGTEQYAYQYGVNACNGGTWTIVNPS